MNVRLRRGRKDDVPAIIDLYKVVGGIIPGIARRPHEVTTEYVSDFVAHSLERGIIIVAEFVKGSHPEPLAGHSERSEESAGSNADPTSLRSSG